MTLPIDAGRASSWVCVENPDADVVLSSRVRFARNLEGVPFPAKASREQQLNLVDQVREVLGKNEELTDGFFLEIQGLEAVEKQFLCERRLASQDLIENPTAGLFFEPDETLSIMINEEDHLRLQAIKGGSQLNEAFREASKLERWLDEQLPFSFHQRWGYLTACPTNVGTGLRASSLLHLPGLVLTNKINKVLKAISNLGLTVRGFYGEGSNSEGFYFQLSNQVTLGRSAQEMKENLEKVTRQTIEHERRARQQLFQKSLTRVEDRVWRAYGVLEYAREIEYSEALQMLSFCRLGVAMDLIPNLDMISLDGLLFQTQPAHLLMELGQNLPSEDRDVFRAQKIREHFSSTPQNDENKNEPERQRDESSHGK